MARETGSGDDVYILGAGFSRSVSLHMPVTDTLGTQCLEIVGSAAGTGLPTTPFTGGQFEAWLSRISEEQPYLNAAHNARNRALFLALSEAMHEVLRDATAAALADGWPRWLPAFLRHAHEGRATLVSFNYDELVECAVASNAILPELRDIGGVSVDSITGSVPPTAPGPPPTGLSFGGTPRSDTFRLLKLHGSLNWYWVDSDPTGTSLLVGPRPGRFAAPTPVTAAALRDRVPGRVPFIVPPAATKSRYFAMPVVRQLWSDAFAAISRAARVTFVGYSLPLEDATFAGLLSTALRERDDVRLGIADCTPTRVIEHVRALRLDHLLDTNDVYSGESSVPGLVDARVAERAAQVPSEVVAYVDGTKVDTATSLSAARLLIEFDRFIVSAVEHAERDGDTVILTAGAPASPGGILGPSDRGGGVTVATLEPLLRDASKIVINVPDGQHVIIGHRLIDRSQYASGPWLALASATTARAVAPDSARSSPSPSALASSP